MKTRERFDKEFKQDSLRIVTEPDGCHRNGVTGDLCTGDHGDDQLCADERRELTRLRWENAELAIERDALKRSVAFWVEEAMRR